MLSGKNILLGVSGGIACYKAAALASSLKKLHADVQVIMTKNAAQFITPLTFEALTGNRVLLDTFDPHNDSAVAHITAAEKADLLLVAPATANVLAKLANGIADDMLTTTALACICPKAAAPAMNTHMLENPVTQDNLEKLRHYGWFLAEPGEGRLACGTTGKGRLPEPEELVELCLYLIAHEKDMAGRRVLVTAGPTQEALDPVRCLTNHSSGKMGYAIAKAAARRGAEVVLVSGPTALQAPQFVNTVPVQSAQEMFDAVMHYAPEADIIIKAAAVADYRPATAADNKLKKGEGELTVPLARTADILAALGAEKKPGQFLCGFSMETENMLENSIKKLKKKNLDLIAANNLKVAGAGFQVDTNVLTLIGPDSVRELPLLSKDAAADALLDEILRRMENKS